MNFSLYNIYNHFDLIKNIWLKLSTSVKTSYFLSWPWIEHWLKSLPAGSKLYLMVGREKDEPCVAFFVGSGTRHVFNLFPVKIISLNNSSVSEYDILCVEYNAILLKSHAHVSLKKILDDIPLKWAEFHFYGMDDVAFPAHSLNRSLEPYSIRIYEKRKSCYVNLKKIQGDKEKYLALLSPNTRDQIRSSFRKYSEKAEVKILQPVSIDEALEIYDEMVRLHRETWKVRGQFCSFQSDYFYQFHKGLILKRFYSGEIQLLKVVRGNETIGCLYNFVHNKIVYFYQCGFNYKSNNKFKPGFLTHAMAIELNSREGNERYDFLAGDSRYKESLSTDYNILTWAIIQQPSAILKLENSARKIKNLIVKATS